MRRRDIKLISVPKSIRPENLDRRRPAPGRFQNLAGAKYDSCEVLGFAGFIGAFAAWLCVCKCGNKFVARGSVLEYKKGQTCGCVNAPKPKKPPAIIGRQIQARGETKNIAEWARVCGISKQAMQVRINKCRELGLDPSVAIELRPREQAKKHVEQVQRSLISRQMKELADAPLPPI